METFLKTAPEGMTRAEEISNTGEELRRSLLDWWNRQGHKLPSKVKTYYGERTAISVLERTTWHAAQHCRQLQAVVENCGIEPDGALGDAELQGLPLPENIYDNEIDMNDADVETKPLML